MNTFTEIGTSIGELVERKNAAYGSSFEKSGQFLALLWPAGIPADRFDDALLMVRIFDKQMRIATDQDAFGESPYGDITGYGILGVSLHQKREQGCGSVSAAGAAEGSKAPDSSAALNADKPATTSARLRSEELSSSPSPRLSKPTSASTVAPAQTATAAASGSVEDLGERSWQARMSIPHSLDRWVARNNDQTCSACAWSIPKLTMVNVKIGGVLLACCTEACASFIRLNERLA